MTPMMNITTVSTIIMTMTMLATKAYLLFLFLMCVVHALLMHFLYQVKKLEGVIQHRVQGIFRRDSTLTRLEAEIDAYEPPLFHLGLQHYFILLQLRMCTCTSHQRIRRFGDVFQEFERG